MSDPRAGAAASPLERELALLEEVRRDLDGVEAALARVDSGSYGFCEACGQPLPKEQLVESPLARLCTAHDNAGP
jgi:DnaK suppressor protein